jgi:hypothetical protein
MQDPPKFAHIRIFGLKIPTPSGNPGWGKESHFKRCRRGSLIFKNCAGKSDGVARWFILKPKIPIWVNFGGFCNGRCWYILLPFGLFYGRLVNFMAIWFSLW